MPTLPLRLYQPIVDIRQIEADWKTAIPAVCKYTAKASDLIESQDWFVNYISQTKGVRRTELGGCFKKYFCDDDGQENLINFDEPEEILEDADAPIVELLGCTVSYLEMTVGIIEQ